MKRRTNEQSISERKYLCGCGKAYLSYPALYLHLKKKHMGKLPAGTVLPNNNFEHSLEMDESAVRVSSSITIHSRTYYSCLRKYPVHISANTRITSRTLTSS